MASLIQRITLLAGLLVWQTARLRRIAHRPISRLRRRGNQPPASAPASQAQMPFQAPSVPAGMPGGQPIAPPAKYGPPQPSGPPWSPAAPQGMMQPPLPMPATPSGMPGGQPVAPPGQYALPQPLVRPENLPAPPPVNGTWRDDGQYVIIEVNGQQLRLGQVGSRPAAGKHACPQSDSDRSRLGSRAIAPAWPPAGRLQCGHRAHARGRRGRRQWDPPSSLRDHRRGRNLRV